MTLAGRLAALGFADTADAQRLLADELGHSPAWPGCCLTSNSWSRCVPMMDCGLG